VFKSSGVHDLSCAFNELRCEARIDQVYRRLNSKKKRCRFDIFFSLQNPNLAFSGYLGCLNLHMSSQLNHVQTTPL